jgi:hypothetical protein
MKECRDVESVAIVIVEQNNDNVNDNDLDLIDLETFSKTTATKSKGQQLPLFRIHKATQDAPNPRDVWEAIHNDAVTIQPKGFGGSAGFGRKLADPTRFPLPQHTVVLCSNEQQCRAAIYAGMRVICLHDNDISDAVVDSLEDIVGLDDIATPGSFWLNPPHARDDQNNPVDPLEVMRQYEQEQREAAGAINGVTELLQDELHVSTQSEYNSNDADAVAEEEMSDDELARILADMD